MNDYKKTSFSCRFVDGIEFSKLKHWCAVYGIKYKEPIADDDWPDWESGIREEIAEAMRSIK